MKRLAKLTLSAKLLEFLSVVYQCWCAFRRYIPVFVERKSPTSHYEIRAHYFQSPRRVSQ